MIKESKEYNTSKELNEYFFLIYFTNIKEIQDNDIKFKNEKNNPKCIFTKKIEPKDGNPKLIKIFKYSFEKKEMMKKNFEFSLSSKEYQLEIKNKKEKSFFNFVFQIILQEKGIFNSKIEQNEINIYDQMNYFIEALNRNKETDKLDLLYLDSIFLYSKKPNFHFLITIFVNVYNTNYCSKLLEEFNKKIDEPLQKDKIMEENLDKYKEIFVDICQNTEDLISSFSLNKIDFYGLVLCYLNNYINEKYQEKFNELYKNDKDTLFEVLLKYKSYFKKQINLETDKLNEIIQFAAGKNYKEFKNNGLFYLNNITIFLEIIEKNKELIIKIKDFEPIEVIKIGNTEEIDFEKIIEKIDIILKFSLEKKIILINFNSEFWESLVSHCSNANMENIKLCYSLREKLLEYIGFLETLFKEGKQKGINSLKNKEGNLVHKLDKNIKSYIQNNNKITNIEIIELIKIYDVYYQKDEHKKKREPEILNKIDLEKIDNEFEVKYKKMDFEEIFKEDLKNYLLVFLNKINNILDFEKLFKLINTKKLGEEKSAFLKSLKNKYKAIIKDSNLSEDSDKKIESLTNLTYFICTNEKDLDFLQKTINNSEEIDNKIKHKIYLKLIILCKKEKSEKNEEINKFISSIYLKNLDSENLNEFIEFLSFLKEDDSNNLIEHLDGRYTISKKEFYSNKDSLNIQLLNLIMQKIKLKKDNKYIVNNISVLEQIFGEIDDKDIKFVELSSFCELDKIKISEKLSALLLLKDKNININLDEIHENLIKYNDTMKNISTKLINYKSSLEEYHRESKKDEINKLNSIIVEIKNGTYKSFNKNRFEIQTLLDELKEIVKKINEVKNSKIFKHYYLKLKNGRNKLKPNENLFDKVYIEFNEFKKHLAEKGADFISNSSNKDNILKDINELTDKDDDIKKELTSLIHGKGNNEELNLIWNSKHYEKDLNSIFYFLNYFPNIKEEVSKIKNKWKKMKEKNMKKILIELQKEGIYDYIKESNYNQKSNYIQIFNSYFEKNQAMDFLYNHSTDDINQLYDKIGPNNTTLSMTDIQDCLNCVGFFQELKEIKHLEDFLNYIKKNMEKNDIYKWFKNFSDTCRSVIELYQNFDFSITIFEEIDIIIKDAKFFFNKNTDEFKYTIDNEDKIITIEKIKELKNKIQVKQEGKNSSKNDNSNKLYEKYKKLKFFKILSSNIEEIYDLISILRSKGSTLPITIRIEIKYPNIQYFLGKEIKEFKDIQKFLTNAKVNIIKKLDSIYKQMTTIRFIYGKQIDSILSHIQGNSTINDFLRYILNLTDCEDDVKEGNKEFHRNVDNYVSGYDLYNDNSFTIIHNYIVSLFKNNNITTIEDHYKNISIKKGNSLKGIYKYFSQSISMEEDIMQIFLDKIGKIPIAQNILVNNKETSFEEMQAFFSRAILCKYNTLFIVKVSNSFSDYQQRCMNIFIDKSLTFKLQKFNEFNEENQVEKSDTSAYMDSCLVFVYTKESESFLNELKVFKPKELILHKENHVLRRTITVDKISSISSVKDTLRDELFNNTHIIQSDICGLGKSTKIKNEIDKLGKKYVYFPLGGNITKNKIYKELEKIMKSINNKNKYKDIAIHLDLFESKEHSVLNEFLFSFLITKFYSSNENVIYIPINIEIFVEIPNCFKDFISNYKILKYFKGFDENESITIEKMPMLNLTDDKIKIFNNMLGLNTNEKILKWVKDNIKIPRYSYHQIKIFINLFISQYNKFGGNKLIFFDENGEDVTKKCIDYFSKGTQYFTFGGFSKLLLTKKNINDNEKDEIDILSEEYSNDLSNEKFIRKLIFIVKNKTENKHVYYNLDISEKALKSGQMLGYFDEKERKKREEMMTRYSQEEIEKLDFLTTLKLILNLKNPVEPSENNSLISLKEIIEEDSYVITRDNFRKMILILYRIISNIPVILMGETGCGKTALIKKLNQLLNNGILKLEIVNIDPSYQDNDIIKKINEINEKSKEFGNNEFWVFFDELNTCDSLALFTEIFINRTCNGIKLKDNIRLIGACNPYRKKKKGVNICGLTYPNNDNELVYLVNVLPQSLMYYVFNFGSLEPENENLYISSIISDTIVDKKLKEATKNIISECHKFLRENFDPSVVSLRELTRFKKIYRFFIEYYKKKYKCLNIDRNQEAEKLKSIIISIYLCYYTRLVDGKTRTKFEGRLKQKFKSLVNYNFDPSLKTENFNENDLIYEGDLKKDLQENYKNIGVSNTFNFSQILSEEENFLLEPENIFLEKGIGKNKSLKENIFSLFTSLNTQIPLIIIGKPGSSKSLSAQLICKEMSGKYSKGKFFKLYPSIIQSYFQGSDTTTPEEVKGIFQIAEGRLDALAKKIKKTDLPISMILFDELGLAERSKYNPLKVLHSFLEFDGNKKGISFVGISNWTLDAAKINRALCLSVPDLDDNEDDLKSTCKSIVESINPEFTSKQIFCSVLPVAYFNYKENLKLLKKLTVYKQYELKEYKYLLYKFRKDEEFKKIFSEYEDLKDFFIRDKENEEDYKRIFSFEIFKKVKKSLKKFFEDKNLKEKEIFKTPFETKEFIKLYENDKKIKEEFHGNRDFYYLIKGIANEMNENNSSDYKGIIKKNIERNFGGLEIVIDFENDYSDLLEMENYGDEKYTEFLADISPKDSYNKDITKKECRSSVQIFKTIYNMICRKNNESDYILEEAHINDYDHMNNIIENIRDTKSRYLLLEIKPSLAPLIRQKISKELKFKQIDKLEGSPFPNDNNNEYQFKVINNIQEYAEKDHLLILQNLKQIYPFLYDLFNKNFVKKDGKNYARICHGNLSDQLTYVNEEFRIIIMVNKKFLDSVDSPFLNRFEKMALSFGELLKDKQNDLCNVILKQLDVKLFEKKLNYEINYKLKDLLIGCKKQDILGMLYYEIDLNEIKKEKNDDDTKKKIFNKIYKLLPQDIIVNMDKGNELKTIYYEKKTYYNLKSYCNKDTLYHKISIIYTFNSITDVIIGVEESSRFKMISEIKSEIQLLNAINNIIEDKNNNKNEIKNLIFIHFDESNSKIIGFLIDFIKHNFDKNQEIKFLFIVHIKRKFLVFQNEEKTIDKIYAIPDINPNINQIFIDNLNGSDIKLQDIVSDPIQTLLKNGVLRINDEFNIILNHFMNENLLVVEGEDNIINADNYQELLEEYFQNDSTFLNSIINKIMNFLKEDKENSNNIIEKIYKSESVNKNCIDLVSVIIDYVKNNIISKYINLILYELEDNNILTTLLFLKYNKNLINDEYNDLVSEMAENYLNQIKMEEKKCEPKFVLKHIIPGFYNFYLKLSNFIDNEIKNDFMKNEKKIRYYLNINKYDIKQNYYKKEEDFLVLTYKEMEKNKFVKEFINKIQHNILINDYITFFLAKYDLDILNYKNSSNNLCKQELLNLILDIRFDEKKRIVEKYKNDSVKLFLIKINWIESNRDYIIKILNIYDILSNIFNKNEFIKIIKESLNKEKLRYITNEKKNPDITIEVNECFYKILASICYSVIPPNIDFKQKIELFDYIDNLKSAMKIIKSLNNDLLTYSIEVELIEELIHIYDILELNEKVNYDRLNEICESLKKNNEILTSSIEIRSDELIDEYKNLYDILKKTLKYTDKNYYELLRFIYYKEIKKVPNVSYRAAIFQDVIKDVEVIVKSKDILDILLHPLVNPEITKFHLSLNEITLSKDYDIAIIIESILENENEENFKALSETLIYHFEKLTLMFFNNIFHYKEKILFENDEEIKIDENEKQDKVKKIVGPLKIFKDCIKFLNDYNKEIIENQKNEGKNKNLKKLFCIAYIKCYCYTFIDLFDSCSPLLEKQSKIIETVNKSKYMTNIISFYIWKIIYNKNNQNIDIFIDPESIKKYKFNEYKFFKNIKYYSNPFNYNYNDQKSKDKYNQFCIILEKYKDKIFEDVNIEEFNKYQNDIDIFYFSTCNLILSHLKQKSFIDSPLYDNFYKKVCIPLYKNKEKIFNAIKIIYEKNKFKRLKDEFGLNPDNLGIILHSYRYFINEINSNSKNSVYNFIYDRHVNLDKIRKNYYPGNDIRNIPIYSIYSQIKTHFIEKPNYGCFVCLCSGGYYHCVRGGKPGPKYLNMKCKSCGQSIGAIANERGFIKPVKRENYYRIFPNKELSDKDAEINNGSYYSMGLEKFTQKYISNEFQKEIGISISDENFFKKTTKIVRFLSNISYRILNFILYSHLFFSRIYNNTEQLNIFLPNNMSWIKVIYECWEMIKIELKKLGINAIDIFMNYIFTDLFSVLNEHKSLNNYNTFIEFEDKLDKLINQKIKEFKEEYQKTNNLNEYDSEDKFFFQNMIEERYRDLNKDEYPFYKYFYYSEYINEEHLLNILNDNDDYPVLLKILNMNIQDNNSNKYSLNNLPIFNEVLNLFNDKYYNSIKREKANKLSLKDIINEESKQSKDNTAITNYTTNKKIISEKR